jgi:hypothetical protein
MLPGMKTDTLGEGRKARKVVFHRVAENLYRLETSGGYYGLVKRGDKQFRRSLRTKDRKLAERRLNELRSQVGNLRITEDAFLSFEDVAKRWMAVTEHTLKPSSALTINRYNTPQATLHLLQMASLRAQSLCRRRAELRSPAPHLCCLVGR